MPTDTRADTREEPISSSWWNLRTARIVRLALATTVTLAIAQIYNWPLSFVAPVLVAALLQAPLRQPSMRSFLKDAVFSVLTVSCAFIFVMLLQPYPLAFAVAWPLVFFTLVYSMRRGFPAMPALIGVISLLALPVLGNIHGGLTAAVAASLMFSPVLALLMIQIGFGLIPDPDGIEKQDSTGFQPGYSPIAARSALITTIVIVPLMMMFASLELAGYLLVLIYVGLMSLAGNFSHGVHGLTKNLLATAIGATASLPFYYLILAVPEFFFFVPLSLLAILLLASRRFSDSAFADYYGSAITAFMILVSASIGPDADLDVNITKRVALIILAGAYAVGVLSIVEPIIKRLWPLKEVEH
jgi:hypothetical protein